MRSIIISFVLELSVISLLIFGFINENKLINFEERQKNYIKKLRKACVKNNVGFFKFLKIVFLCSITKEEKIDELREKLFPQNNRKIEEGGQDNV